MGALGRVAVAGNERGERIDQAWAAIGCGQQ
jgi:hypothetical protein